MTPQAIAERLEITEAELHDRRSIMLRSFKSRPSSGLETGSRAPLDYERPKRRANGWAA
jgi:hypothetical protein